MAENLNETPDGSDDDDSTNVEPSGPAPTVIPSEYIKSIGDSCYHFNVPASYSSLIPINYLQIFSDSLSIGASIKQIIPTVSNDINVILNFKATRSETDNITSYEISEINKDECFIHTSESSTLKLINSFISGLNMNEYSYLSINDQRLQEFIKRLAPETDVDGILNSATQLIKGMVKQYDLSFFRIEFLNPQTQRYVKYSVVGGKINGTLVPLAEGSEIDCKYVTPDDRARPLYDDCIDYGSVFDIKINLVNNTIYSKLTSNMNMGGGMGNAELKVFAKLLYDRIPMFNYTVLNLTTILRNDTYVTIHDDTTLGVMQMVLDRTISPGQHIPFNDLDYIFSGMMGLNSDYEIIESIGLGYMDDYHFYALKNGTAYLEVYDYKFTAEKLEPCVPNTEVGEDGVWIFSYNVFLLFFTVLVLIM